MDEDYGDYVTRCVCGFTHDDGYMICCDGCGVWQHVECMKVNPKNLPDKYLCEQCHPRSVDRKRARALQLRKKEELSDFDDDDGSDDSRRSSCSSPTHLHQPNIKKRKKQYRPAAGTRVQELKVEARKSSRKDKGDKEKDESRKGKKKVKSQQPSPGQFSHPMSGVQTLLNAASALEQQQQQQHVDVWNMSDSPWTDPYENCDRNLYSETVRAFLEGPVHVTRSEATMYSREEYQTIETRLSHPLCAVKELCHQRKGLVAETGLPGSLLAMEYKGKVLLQHELQVPGGSAGLLWKQSPCPFVYLYNRLDMCVDARHFGNETRFIRRSCHPNVEMRHFFVGTDIHFGVFTVRMIPAGEELTLPFDFRYDKCDYPVECACDSETMCRLVGVKNISPERRKIHRTSSNEEECSQMRTAKATPVAMPPGQVFDEDSNSSWTSIGSHHKRARVFSSRTSREVTDSESEEPDDGEAGKGRKSREERKTEAVWRIMQKMEASQRRRQQHLHSEGSIDGDRSPSVPRGIKERKTSTSSNRKVQLLPTNKPRLSSVSSVDLLSPEPSETFSPPPFSTSLSTNTDLSPPSSSVPKLSFEVTPHLHPKYLLADFALPRKKAILQQWEADNRRGGGSQYLVLNGGSNWATNGYAVVSSMTADENRPRVKGCLKHWWMKQHQKEEEKLTIDTMAENGCSLPYKRNLLQRWQAVQLERVENEGKTEKLKEDKDDEDEEDRKEKPSSPLFDDFSDDEFDVVRKDAQSELMEETSSDKALTTAATTSQPDLTSDIEHEDMKTVSSPSGLPEPSISSSAPALPSALSPPRSLEQPVTPVLPPPLSENRSKLLRTEEDPVTDTEQGAREEVEMELSSPQPTLKQQANQSEDTTSPTSITPSDVSMAESSLLEEGGDKMSSDMDLSSKPAGKKKMSLLEYRSRAKRPAASDGKKTEPSASTSPSLERVPSFPLSSASCSTPSCSTSSVSFLSFSSSFLSGSSGLPSYPPLPPPQAPSSHHLSATSTPTRQESGRPQFEPVSPDEDELVHRKEDAAPIVCSSQPVNTPIVTSAAVLPSDQRLGMGLLPTPVPVAQYIVDSHWNTPSAIETQDPRRATTHVYPQDPHCPIHYPVHTIAASLSQAPSLLPASTAAVVPQHVHLPPPPPPQAGSYSRPVFRPPHNPHGNSYMY